MKEEGWSKDFDENEDEEQEMDKELNGALSAARAWMEIAPAEGTSYSGSLQVGELARMAIKCTLPGTCLIFHYIFTYLCVFICNGFLFIKIKSNFCV